MPGATSFGFLSSNMSLRSVNDTTELFNAHLRELLTGIADKKLRQAAVRIYLRDLLVLTHPEEWERQEDAVWLQGQGATIALHCFRAGICCAVACQQPEGATKHFNWAHLDQQSNALKREAEEGHLSALGASEIAIGQLAGNLTFLETFEPTPKGLEEFLSSAEIQPEDMEAATRELLADYTFELRTDLDGNAPTGMFRKALFSPDNISDFTSAPHHIIVYFLDSLSNAGDTWNFWYDWYSGFLEGNPIDWKMQDFVASISDAIWDAGPEAVAQEIARMKVNMALEDFRGLYGSSRTTRHGVGGNYPPEAIEEPKDFVSAAATIWEAIDDIEDEIDKPKPDRGSLKIALTALKSGLAALIMWSGRKADLAVDTSIKWAIPVVGGAYLAAHPQKIQALIEAVEEWLKFIP